MYSCSCYIHISFGFCSSYLGNGLLSVDLMELNDSFNLSFLLLIYMLSNYKVKMKHVAFECHCTHFVIQYM